MSHDGLIRYRIAGIDYTLSKPLLRQFARWILLAAVGFIAAVLLYQVQVAFISYSLNYVTKVHFAKVDSMPHLASYWNDYRVVAIYVLPPVMLLLFSFLLLTYMIIYRYSVSMWRWFMMWFIMFGIVLSTTLMSVSVFSSLEVGGSLFQGFAVVMLWFDLPIVSSLLFFAFAMSINVGCGLICADIFIYLAPEDFVIKRDGDDTGLQRIAFKSFAYVVLPLFAVAIWLSYPHYYSFFVFMFLHIFLWLPGLLIISPEGLTRRQLRVLSIRPIPVYLLSGLVIGLIVFLKLFFS